MCSASSPVLLLLQEKNKLLLARQSRFPSDFSALLRTANKKRMTCSLFQMKMAIEDGRRKEMKIARVKRIGERDCSDDLPQNSFPVKSLQWFLANHTCRQTIPRRYSEFPKMAFNGKNMTRESDGKQSEKSSSCFK